MRSVIPALLLAAALAPLAGLAEDNPFKRCKNHYILRPQGCEIDENPQGWREVKPPLMLHGKHTATLLRDGRLLVAGDTSVPLMTAEIYDPVLDTWTLTKPMTQDRAGHTATLLADGRVLVLGGEKRRAYDGWFWDEGTAEIFDPFTNEWTAAATMPTVRGGFTATLLPDGRVLVAGGVDSRDDSVRTVELFDPESGTWSAGPPLHTARFWHTATALRDGNVLVVGGWYDDWLQKQVAETELYDWKGAGWVDAGLIIGRGAHTATLLDNGNVLVAGGYTSGFKDDGWRLFSTVDLADVFDATTYAWKPTGSIGTPRFGHLAAPLANGGALIVQGTQSFNQPPSVTYGSVDNAMAFSGELWSDLGMPTVETNASTVTRLDDGSLLFVGNKRAVLYRY